MELPFLTTRCHHVLYLSWKVFGPLADFPALPLWNIRSKVSSFLFFSNPKLFCVTGLPPRKGNQYQAHLENITFPDKFLSLYQNKKGVDTVLESIQITNCYYNRVMNVDR